MNVQAFIVAAYKRLWSCILVGVIPAIVFYGASLLILRQQGYSTIQILRDPAQQTGASSLIGFLSNVGIWFWVGSAAVHFFAFIYQQGRGTARARELSLLLGLLSLLLAADDFFMIHDRYVNEHLCYLIYFLLAISLAIRHWRILLTPAHISFFLGAGLMGMSIFTDMSQDYLPASYYDRLQIFEEGCKFVGGAVWFYFAINLSRSLFDSFGGQGKG